MILLITTMLGLILGIVAIKIGLKYYKDGLTIIGLVTTVIHVIMIVIELIIILTKPLDAIDFKSKYEVIQQMATEKDDIRDATFTQNIIKINQTINDNRIWKDSLFVGIFYNEEIADMEFLKK